MGYALLSPPLAFAILFLAILGLFQWSKRLSTPGEEVQGKRAGYFCGEETDLFEQPSSGGKLRPDYRRFFGAAFLFTVIEVGVLLLATVPSGLAALPGLAVLLLGLASVFGLIMEVL
jgi:NADH:ubiquinone oxidoreductase subunit 3 (subunit A)